MSDYGFILTLPGYDYDKATPEQCVVHSKYPSPMINALVTPKHYGLVSVLFSSTIPSSTTRTLYSMNHNLGYTPVVWCLFNDPNNVTAAYTNYGIMPYFYGSGTLRAWADDTKFVIDIVQDFVDSSAITGLTMTFRYYIFSESAV